MHSSYLSREPRVYSCKFFLAGVNFYRFNAKNWHFRQILRKKVAFFFTDLTWKIGVFGCKFYSHKNCVSVKKMTIIRYDTFEFDVILMLLFNFIFIMILISAFWSYIWITLVIFIWHVCLVMKNKNGFGLAPVDIYHQRFDNDLTISQNMCKSHVMVTPER